MSSNNYFGFTHGGTQYGQAGSYQTTQTGYAVTPTYAAQRTGYEAAYQPAATNSAPATAYAGTYGAVGAGATTAATYDYGYGRPAAATYDTSKTYYPQPAAAATYATSDYQQATTKPAYSTTSAYTGANRQVSQAQQSKVAANYTVNTGAYQTQTPQPVAATYTTNYATTQQQTATQTIKQDKKPVKYAASATYQTQGQIASQTAPASTIATYTTNYAAPQAQQVTTIQTTAPAVQAVTAATPTYTGYDAALYNATMYVAQQAASTVVSKSAANVKTGVAAHWQQFKKPPGTIGPIGIRRTKAPPKPQEMLYCEVCKISCGGPHTYREHLEGQRHKKKELAAKAGAPSIPASRRSNSFICELCDVTCTGNDAYAAHIRGSKHQKVINLHTRLGKPIPTTDPTVLTSKKAANSAGNAAGNVGGDKKPVTGPPNMSFVSGGALNTTVKKDDDNAEMDTSEGDIEPEILPVGQDYIEELKNEEGKTVFNCKLCDCKFNDPNAKEMHMKGRRHRLQYKKKVNPQLVVDIKPNNRTKKLHEERLRKREEYFRQREEGWGRRWDDRRRFEDEQEFMDWCSRRSLLAPGVPGPRPWNMNNHQPPPPLAPFFQMRRPDSTDDRHVIARHASIYPKKEELDAVQKIVSHTEKALKFVSDFLTDEANKKLAPTAKSAGTTTSTTTAVAAAAGTTAIKQEDVKKEEVKKVDGSDGTLFSFHRDKDETQPRMLKGVMRVGSLAKGLLLTGDTAVDLVVLCSEKPTRTLLFKVAENLPKQLQVVAPEDKYMVQKKPEDAAITVMDTKEPHNTVTITLTSPVMREQPVAELQQQQPPADVKPGTMNKPPVQKDPPDVLDKNKCLDALAALRHAKWFQARAQGLHSCVMVIRIFRDLCQRVPTWAPLNSWALELLVEKVISSANCPLSLAESVRRVLEAVSSGVLLPGGPGLMDPCEKEPVDAVGNISNQQREDITASAQHALRLVAFRQIHKVLGMDPLPIPKFNKNRFGPRKRRREGSGGEGGDGKKDKKEEDEDEEEENK